MRLRFLVLSLLAGLLIGCGGGSSSDENQGSASTTGPDVTGSEVVETPNATALGEAISFADHVSPGDCFNEVIDSEGNFDYTVPPVLVDCDEQHLSEAFLEIPYPEGDGSHPSEDSLSEFVDDECEPGFLEYTGIESSEGALQWHGVWPKEDEWTAGERNVVCSAWLDDAPLRGSVVGIGDGVRPGNLSETVPLPDGLRLLRVGSVADGAPMPPDFVLHQSGMALDNFFFATFESEAASDRLRTFTEDAISTAGWSIGWTLDQEGVIFYAASGGNDVALIVLYDDRSNYGLYYEPASE